MREKIAGVNALILGGKDSGWGVYAKNVINQLDKLGMRMIIYTLCPDSLSVYNSKIKKVFINTSFMNKNFHLKRIFWCFSVLPFYLMKDKISFLFNLIPEGPIWLPLPQITTIHDLVPLNFPQCYSSQRYYFKYFVSQVIKRSICLIVYSQNTKKDIIKFYGTKSEKIKIISLGVDRNVFHPVRDEEFKIRYNLEKYILYVGNLLPHKNLSRLVKAYALIQKRLPHKLIIVGYRDPRYYPFLKRLVERLKLQDKVHFLDYLPLKDLPLFMSHADVFVFPSLYEGFGLPPLEAMACGCPVVTSRVASLPEVCGEAVYYIDPCDPESIAEGIKEVLINKDLKDSLIKRGLERAKIFDWQKTAQRLVEIFKEMSLL